MNKLMLVAVVVAQHVLVSIHPSKMEIPPGPYEILNWDEHSRLRIAGSRKYAKLQSLEMVKEAAIRMKEQPLGDSLIYGFFLARVHLEWSTLHFGRDQDDYPAQTHRDLVTQTPQISMSPSGVDCPHNFVQDLRKGNHHCCDR